MKLLSRALVASLVMALLAAGMTVQPASAEVDAGIDSVAEVEEAVEEILDATPVDELVEETAADVSDLEIDEDAADVVVELETDDGSVKIPAEADEAVVIESAEGDGDLQVELPGNGDDAEVTDDGSVVYEDILPDTDIVVQAQDDGGVRIMAVVDGTDAPSAFDFPLRGKVRQLAVGSDGSVLALGKNDKPLYMVDKPWAYDAAGNEVASWYTVDGRNLVLNIDHADVEAYPVAADPKIHKTFYGLITHKYNKFESDKLISLVAAGAATATLISAACGTATAGLCAAPYPLIIAIIGLTGAALKLCQNSKGLDIHSWGLQPHNAIWCTGY